MKAAVRRGARVRIPNSVRMAAHQMGASVRMIVNSDAEGDGASAGDPNRVTKSRGGYRMLQTHSATALHEVLNGGAWTALREMVA